MKKEAFTRKSTYLAALAVLLIASFVAGTLAASNQPVDAQGVNPLAAVAPSGNVTCTIGAIGVSDSLLLVYCSDPSQYLGYPTTSPAEARTANRYLATLFTAYALGKPVVAYFDDDLAHSPPGCPVSPCPLIVGLGLQP